LRVRKPNRYTVRTGATLNVQDVAEEYINVTCTTQKGVDIKFTSADLTLTIDDFSERYLTPAMSLLASTIDLDGLTLANDIYNLVGSPTATPNTLLAWLQGSSKMTDLCAPKDPRYAVMTPLTSATMADALKGILNPQANIGEMYLKGMVSDAAGMKWAETQNIPTYTPGTRAASSQTTTNGATASGATTLVLTTGSGVTFKKGDVFTFVSGTEVYSVNPETKVSTGQRQQFVVTADATATGTDVTLSISPAIITSGATQTVTAVPDSGAALTFIGAASTAYKNNIMYNPLAFTLVTADLVEPKGVDFARREVMDNISMRIVRAYDINNDTYPCRIDVFYGWTTVYPEWACRHVGV
jgi:hypothetical protein